MSFKPSSFMSILLLAQFYLWQSSDYQSDGWSGKKIKRIMPDEDAKEGR
jgi:hypothetical protein